MEISLTPSIPPPFEPYLLLIDLPTAAAVGIAITVGVALWGKHFNAPQSQASKDVGRLVYNPNRFLTLFLLLVSYAMVEALIVDRGYFYYIPQLFFLYAFPRYLVIGPLVYFYVRTTTSPEPVKYSHWHLLHLLPAVCTIIMQSPFTSMLSVDSWLLIAYQDIYALDSDVGVHIEGLMNSYGSLQLTGAGFSQTIVIDNLFGAMFVYFTLLNIENILEIISIWSYMGVCFWLLLRHKKNLGQITSTMEGIELKWMLNFLATVVFVFAILTVDRIVDISGRFQEYFYLRGLALDILAVFMMFYIGMKALKQPQIFSPELRTGFQAANSPTLATDLEANNLTEGNQGQSDTAYKYRSSNLNPELSANLAKQIRDYVEINKPYLCADLTLVELAKQMDLSTHTLSQVLNETIGQNFFDFINRYRIEAVKASLDTNTGAVDSILQIAMDSGFNSKSAFYSVFKKQVGMSPSQWRTARKTKSSKPHGHK